MADITAHDRIKTFSIGNTIGASISIYFRNFFFLTIVYAAISALAILLLRYYASSNLFNIYYYRIFTSILDIFVQALFTSIAVYVVVMQLKGKKTGIIEALVKGTGRSIFAVTTTFVILIGIILSIAIPIAILGALQVRIWFIPFLFIIPGIILYCRWFLAVPAATIERIGPFSAASRSSALTKGYRWRIFGLLLIFILVRIGIQYTATKLYMQPELRDAVWFSVTFVFPVLLGAIQAVATAYAYYAIAIEKDGVGVDDIAKVFE